MNYFTSHYLRALFYSLTLVLGINLSLLELDRGSLDGFIQISGMVSIVFVIELISGLEYRRITRKQSPLKKLSEYGRIPQIIHHLVIPITFYLTLIGFSYYNRQTDLRLPILAMALFVFTGLFAHIRAFYQEEPNIIKQTFYIYDIAKLIIFFQAANTIINLFYFYDYQVLGITLSIFSLTILLLVLATYRHGQLHFRSAITIIAFAVVSAAVIAALLIFVTFSPLLLSIVCVLVYYISAATLNHLIHNDLDLAIVVEYFLVIAIALALMASMV